MGEIADDTLDGIFCQACGGFIGEAVGYPRCCTSCAAGEYDKKAIKRERRESATGDFREASTLAAQNGLTLTRKSETHYQLTSKSGWLMNVYPGNCRLYHDRNRPAAPYLRVPSPWTLADIVRAAIKAEGIEVVDG